MLCEVAGMEQSGEGPAGLVMQEMRTQASSGNRTPQHWGAGPSEMNSSLGSSPGPTLNPGTASHARKGCALGDVEMDP